MRSDNRHPNPRNSDLYEDGKLLGPPRIAHVLISDIGGGLLLALAGRGDFCELGQFRPEKRTDVSYEARAPVAPAPWLILLAAALFAAALGAAWRRRLRTGSDTRWADFAATLPSAIAFGAALVATVSLLGVFRTERVVSAAALSPDFPQAILDRADRVSRNGAYMLDFPRFYAPFLEIDCCARVDVRRGEIPVLHDDEFDPDAGTIRGHCT